jgi:ABC-type glycerol-3-phosphate transport system substrate-binding protein
LHSRSFRAARLLVAGLAVVSLAAACGGDDGEDAADDTTEDTSAETTTTTEATTTTSVDTAADEEAAGKVISDFFTAFGKAEFDTTVALMENGEDYRARFLHCENLTTAFSGVAVKTVEVDGDTAALTYDILGPDGTTPLIEGSQGSAVKVDGEWLVAENTFLSLYDAAKDGCTGPPPPA